jgi:hypothetical protein
MLVKLLLVLVLAIPVAGLLVWTWRRSPNEASKHLAQTLESGGVEFSPPVHAWIERNFAWRERLSQSGFFVAMFLAFSVADWDPTRWRFVVALLALIALVAGTSFGSVLLMLPRVRADRSATRVAVLRPRTVRSYLHPAELIAYALLPLVGLACLALTITARPGDDDQARPVLALIGAVLALLILAGVLLQRYLVRLPQNAANQEEQLACDLLVSIALRELFAGVGMPTMILFVIAWQAVSDAGGDLPASGYVLAALVVALLGAFFLLPTPTRRQQHLWRFRRDDERAPA